MTNQESIVETLVGTIKVVQYNKPTKKNAIDMDMYKKVIKILEEAANNDRITMMVLTGTGDYYSSGNDLTATLSNARDHSLLNVLKEFINSFITFPKLLVAIVNGPAIGIAATTLALCDLVFAAENSYFYTPFSKLGMVAEGCSTYTFPRLMGDRKAAEMLLFNHKMSAREALEWGFVNYVYKPEELQTIVWNKIMEVSKLPQHSLTASKRLMRGEHHDVLKKTNEKEMDELDKIWCSGEYLNNVKNFYKSKSKM